MYTENRDTRGVSDDDEEYVALIVMMADGIFTCLNHHIRDMI